MRRELHRVRHLIRKGEGTAEEDEELSGGPARASQSATSLEDRLTFLSDLTPRESFNRWLMECRSITAKHADPLIPSIQHALNAKKTLSEAVLLHISHNEHAAKSGELVSSTMCATGRTRAVKAIPQAATQMHKKCRVQGLNDEKGEEPNAFEGTSARGISGFDCSSMETLEREILEDLPVKVAISSTAAKTRNHLVEYARAVSAVMLAEKQKVEGISLDALSPLVEALLLLLRGERVDSSRDVDASRTDSFDTPNKGAAYLLSLLSLELQHQRHTRGLGSSHCDARGDAGTSVRQSELQEAVASTRCMHTVSVEQDLSKKIRRLPESCWNESLHAPEPPCVIRGSRAAHVNQVAYSDDEATMYTTLLEPADGRFAEGGCSVIANETVPCTSFATDSVATNIGAESNRFSKDGVYHIVCLARPVLTVIYGDKVRALVKHVEEVAQEAAARVAQYAACLAVAPAADGEPSAHRSRICTLNGIRGARIHSIVGDAKAGVAVAPPEGQCVEKDASSATVSGPAADRSTPEGNNVGGEDTAVRAQVPDRTAAVIHKGTAARLNTSMSRDHSVVCALEDASGSQPLMNFWSPHSCASKGHFVFNNIRWLSCRVHERFMYDGDVEMLARDDCESVCTDNFKSFKSAYNLKSYKVVQLWARFITEKLEQGGNNLVEVDCMRVECVCKGRGVCGGDWTCSCVRKQIQRIQSSAYAGEFTVMIFCLLCRYYSVCGCRKQGKGLHSAAPGELMQVLKQRMGVECELFASPLNVCLNTYCSLFPDIDKFFGSKGSFFDPNFTIKEGSYEANPPFEEIIMKRVVFRIEQWLDASGEGRSQMDAQSPLSFCLLVPYWPAGPSQYLSALLHSKYARFFTVLPEKQHYFLSGFQHFCPTAEVTKAAVCKTLFAVLQNEAGARKWPITPEIVEQIKATWKPGSMSYATVRKRREKFCLESELTL